MKWIQLSGWWRCLLLAWNQSPFIWKYTFLLLFIFANVFKGQHSWRTIMSEMVHERGSSFSNHCANPLYHFATVSLQTNKGVAQCALLFCHCISVRPLYHFPLSERQVECISLWQVYRSTIGQLHFRPGWDTCLQIRSTLESRATSYELSFFVIFVSDMCVW